MHDIRLLFFYDGDKPIISYSLTAIESVEEEKYKVNIYDFLKDIF